MGSKAQEKLLADRLNLFKQNLLQKQAAVRDLESKENSESKDEKEAKKRMGERELNALLVSRQIAAREAELQKVREREQAERANRKAHPIDILHKQIAQELIEEGVAETTQLGITLEQESLGLDHYLETEQQKQLRFKYFSPSKHVPNGF